MSDNDEKTRIVRPLEQLQRPANTELNDPDETRKVERDDATVTTGQDAHSITPIRTAGEEKTVLFRPSPNRSGEGTMFNPLAPKGESGGSEDPVVGWLVIVKGPGRGNAVRLGYGWNSIGRDASQRACLDFGDSQISRLNHAKLLYDPRARKFTLTLGESTNPTYVRGDVLLGPTEVVSGDRIQLGDTEVLFLALCGETFDWQGQHMRPETDFAGRQVHGSRETQDDYYGFCPLSAETDGFDGLLLGLADGMGGYKGGSMASRKVVESFIEHFCFTRGSIPERLLSSLHACRRQLLEEIARHDESFGQMGSTLVAVVWSGQRLHWVSVGDSGLYLFRDGAIRRINADHSMTPVLAEQVSRGEMTAEEAAQHPDRHALRSALAARPLTEFELRDQPFELQRGDIVFAATDGLASLSPAAVTERLQTNARQSAAHIASALLLAVNELGRKKQDNTTVAVVRQE